MSKKYILNDICHLYFMLLTIFIYFVFRNNTNDKIIPLSDFFELSVYKLIMNFDFHKLHKTCNCK